MFLIPASRRGHANRTYYVNRAFDRLFDDTLAHVFAPRAQSAESAARSPALDVSETDSTYTVTVDLPGVSKEDVKVSVDGRVVTLEAQAQPAQETKEGERVVYRERSAVSYSRSVTLPVEVDEAASQAKLDNGVLTLTLAKKVAPGAARIAVN